MKYFFVFSILIFFLSFHAIAQETDDLLNVDLDSIFDGTFTDNNNSSKPEEETKPVNVNQTGITFGASYNFKGGFAPGWNLAPWHFDGTEERTWGAGAKMVSNLNINVQLSEVFKVYTSFDFILPGFQKANTSIDNTLPFFQFVLGDFFFDYNILNRVFFRVGKYEHTWGYSSFTNLLARVPEPDDGPSGPSYIVKADIPLGIGGFQLLALTRYDIAGNVIPEQWSDLGYGIKYNAALRLIDIDIGVFYQRYAMPTRGFLSVKMTLGDTEVYNEYMIAVNTHTDNTSHFAADIGFLRNFFNNKLTIGGEVFYNAEKNTWLFKPENKYMDAETAQIMERINIGLNFLYRIDGKGSPRLFTSINYLPFENSAQLVPGIRFTPFKHVEVYCAVPMALGSKDSFYYMQNADPFNRPFSIILLVTLSGNVSASSFK